MVLSERSACSGRRRDQPSLTSTTSGLWSDGMGFTSRPSLPISTMLRQASTRLRDGSTKTWSTWSPHL
ncbi:hypothetical protein C3E78_02685 [Aeromicrobium chenweiae]|uniref:Uncharacterized protein n=1 Tax=Aeromicrobium chenweiae TaxID=2079793 RepID=A0A2S0WIQ3_9ACTN|nr:hypothetical protein C3E78_02685 [Aeromicrobium chenweiae]